MSISAVGTTSSASTLLSARTASPGGASFEDFLAASSSSTTTAMAAAPTTKITVPLTEAQKLAQLKDALIAFEKEAKLTPAQRARRAVLKAMNLTEGTLNAMPPAERDVAEQKIAVAVAKLLRLDKPLRTDAAAGGIDPVALLTPAAPQGLA